MRFSKLIVTRCEKTADEYPCHCILPFEFDGNGIELEIVRCSVMSNNMGHSIVNIRNTGQTDIPVGHFSCDIGECTISKITSSRFMALVSNRRCVLADTICKSDCYLLSAIPQTNLITEWTVMSRNTRNIHCLMADLKSMGHEVEMVSANNADISMNLSAKQETYMKMAFDLGYYDVPKRIGNEELCEIIGCSKSTFNVTLRNAEKKIITLHMLSEKNRISSPGKR